jgi:hypothetical protein
MKKITAGVLSLTAFLAITIGTSFATPDMACCKDKSPVDMTCCKHIAMPCCHLNHK